MVEMVEMEPVVVVVGVLLEPMKVVEMVEMEPLL